MADKDIAPELIDKVNRSFDTNLEKDKKVKALNDKLAGGKADYKDAYAYAESVGNARAKAFGDQISSDILPDGKMHYNIASRLLEDSLTTDHDMVAAYSSEVQRIYNEKAGIGLKALTPDVDQDRINGFVEGVCNADTFDDVAWKLAEPVITHARSVVDDTIKKNAEFQYKAGVKASVKRNADSKCCEWCSELAGDYTYPSVPREVFQRHDNCKCTVDYEGKKLKAYNSGGKAHSFRDQEDRERIEERKKYNNSVKLNTGTKRDNIKFMASEQSLRTKNGGEYGVNWEIVKSKEYTERFNAISDNQEANALAAQRARNALVNRNGKKTEELYAISLSSGKDISKIVNQNIDFGVKRTEKFTLDINRATERHEKILLIHNHPRGMPPSVLDINELINSGDAIGITVGHDGSIFLYGKPNAIITEHDEAIASMKLLWYSEDVRENQIRVIEELSKTFNFVFKEL